MVDLISIHNKLNLEKCKESPRDYLGLSMIGNGCYRYIQLYHYWTFEYEVTSRVKRLLNFGHLAEEMMIKDLESAGISVSRESETLIGMAGHWRGHIDGHSDSYLVEFKTHNDKSFKEAVKKGISISKPEYNDQVQAYMGYSGYVHCIHVNYNKNTSEYYIEIIDFDENRFKELKRKESEILMAEELLPRIGNNNISWFKCKMCNAKNTCFNKIEIKNTCRSCNHADVENNGVWSCNKYNKVLTIDEQKEACNQYTLAGMFKDED